MKNQRKDLDRIDDMYRKVHLAIDVLEIILIARKLIEKRKGN